MNNRASIREVGTDAFRKFVDGQFGRVPDICRKMLVGLAEFVDSIDEIGNVTEAACLLPVTVHRNWLTAERLKHEIRERAAIVEPHARTIGIEDAHDMRVDIVVAVIGHGDGLREPFRFVIDAARSDGIHMPPVGLALGRDVRIAVAFARRSEQKLGAFGLGEFERVHRGNGTNLEGFEWKLQIVRRTGGRSEVENIANLALYSNGFRNVLPFETESRIPSQVAKVAFVSGDQIVKREHLPAFRQKPVAKMRPEESRSTRDYCSHSASRHSKKVHFNLPTRNSGNSIPIVRPKQCAFDAQNEAG